MQQFLKAPLFLGWRRQGLIGGSEAGFQPPLSQALSCLNTPSFPPKQCSRTATGDLQLWATLGLQWLIKLTTWLVTPPSITGKTSWSKWKHSPCLPATHPPHHPQHTGKHPGLKVCSQWPSSSPSPMKTFSVHIQGVDSTRRSHNWANYA